MTVRPEQLARRALRREWEQLTERERDVIESVLGRRSIVRDVDAELGGARTFGQEMADRLARFGGSWTFILLFSAFLALWALVNGVLLGTRAFDPYPFIFLNLLLSMLASLQAPVIMMSQNRQAARDRLHAEHDYEVNLKAELEIRSLHEKLAELREGRWQELLQYQREQIALLQRMAAASGGDGARDG